MDLDSASRIYSNYAMGRGFSAVNIALIPMLALFDFATAFPSVIHDWIFINLEDRENSLHGSFGLLKRYIRMPPRIVLMVEI